MRYCICCVGVIDGEKALDRKRIHQTRSKTACLVINATVTCSETYNTKKVGVEPAVLVILRHAVMLLRLVVLVG